MVYAYQVVDVFTENRFEGNPLAVFTDAVGLDGTTMQQIAREMNLSETTFVFPATRPDCVARVRIFTPTRELPFAGHPMIGTSFVLMDDRPGLAEESTFVLDEQVGPVPIRVERSGRPLIWLRTPEIQHGREYPRPACAEVVHLPVDDLLPVTPQWVSAGNPMLFIPVKDREAVDRASLDLERFARLKDGPERLGVFVFTPTPEGAYSRMFGSDYGIREDPATGSATGPLASYMMRTGLVARADGTRFYSEQGTCMGRPSFLHVVVHGDNGSRGIDVGGFVTAVAKGTLTV